MPRHPKPAPPPPAALPYEGIESGRVWTPSLTRAADTSSTLTLAYSFPQVASAYGRGYSEANKFVAFNSSEIAAFQPVVSLVNTYIRG